jgi:tetraacyldisaccharide 4'-kinase
MKWITDAWYARRSWIRVLAPLSAVFARIARKRREHFLASLDQRSPCALPVIIIGNISVGGTGKSPLVLHLVEWLRQQGHRPGVISRGYGGQSDNYPLMVTESTSAAEAGDEPCMLFRAARCPVVVSPRRVEAADMIAEQTDCTLILSDDGLQHYQMPRDIELVVIDAARGLGNGLCLPAGPLREPPDRLGSVDMIILNGEGPSPAPDRIPAFHMFLEASHWCQPGNEALPVSDVAPFGKGPVHVVAGIGNPDRVFRTVGLLGLEVIEHPFPDHHAFTPRDLDFGDNLPLVMTEKDAVKCLDFWPENAWYLRVAPRLDEGFYTLLQQQINKAIASRSSL